MTSLRQGSDGQHVPFDGAAFQIQGSTFAIAVTQSSGGVQVTGSATGNFCAYMIHNGGSNVCYVAVSPTSTPTAAVPAAGSSGLGVSIPAGLVEVFVAPKNAYWAAICDTGNTTTLYITQGSGY